jgi:hypothetical protein
MPRKQKHVFVSYSHTDASLIAPVVKLLRLNKSLIFQDIDGIQPGKKWRSEIATALAESHLVVVFWCEHASRSDEVSKEWRAAIAQQKDLLPVLLDRTPLPQELSEFEYIDFRTIVGSNHTSIDSTDIGRRIATLVETEIFRRLYPYDVFISFAISLPPRGTQSYVSDLARRLRERNLNVFFREDEAPGEQLDSALRAALRYSKALVVVANRGALQESRVVRHEYEQFRKRHQDRCVILISDALQDSRSEELEWLGAEIWIEESEEAIAKGIASEPVIKRLVGILPEKLNVKRAVTLLVISMLVALAIGYYFL